jgi:hypothetical protein
MNLSSAAVAQAAALPLAGLLPPPVVVHRSVVIVAAGGRDLSWPQERIASALLQRSGGRAVHLLLHGGARGADQAIGRAAHHHREPDGAEYEADSKGAEQVSFKQAHEKAARKGSND